MTNLGLTFVDAKNAVFSYDNDKRRIGYSRENEAVAQENGEIIWSLVLYLVPLPLKYNNEMGSKEKLVERFKKRPKDFTYEETISLLSYFGYDVHKKGATSGSRVRFKNEQSGIYIDIHRPHPGSIMKEWMIKAIYQHLKSNNLI